MGTTVTGVMFDGVELGLAHIGDSRAYLYRDGQLERLTHDHTWVQSLVDDGKISESEAALHPHRSLLLKVLNGQTTNDPDLTMVPVKAGDRLDVLQRRRLRTDRRRHDRDRPPASRPQRRRQASGRRIS